MSLPKYIPPDPLIVKSYFTNIGWGVKEPERFMKLIEEARSLVIEGTYFADNLFTWGRNNSLFDDVAFFESWQLNSLSPKDGAIAWRRYILATLAYHAVQLPGDFVECGAYRGTGVKTVMDYLGGVAFPKPFWVYDTFDTNPNPDHAFDDQKEGLFEEVKLRFTGYEQVRLIKGLIPDIFASHCPEKIAYLHIDLNNADAEIASLDKLFDRVVPGGAIILDDYEWAGAYRGQKIAEDTWLDRRNYRVIPLPTGQGFVIKR